MPTGADLLESLLEEWPEFLGYLISFAFIGGSWMTHARTTRLMEGSDTLASGLNLLALLFIALLPFSTNLMVSNLSGPDSGVAVLVYGLNVFVASVMLTLLMAYLVRQRSLLGGEVADEKLASLTRQRRISNGVWLIAVVVALVAPPIAVGLYVLATVLMLAQPFLRVRRMSSAASRSSATDAPSSLAPSSAADSRGPKAKPSSSSIQWRSWRYTVGAPTSGA